MQLSSRLDAEQRYTFLRNQAYNATNQIIKKDGLTSTHITAEALSEVELWASKSIMRRVDWNWRHEKNHYVSRYPKRFELALWQSHALVGISLGRPTCNAVGLRLDVVEASPCDMSDRPKVINHILTAYEVYAELIGAKHIRIINPINDIVTKYYEKAGYTYIEKEHYLTRDI